MHGKVALYFVGESKTAALCGLVYDNSDDALECAHENRLKVYAVDVDVDTADFERVK